MPSSTYLSPTPSAPPSPTPPPPTSAPPPALTPSFPAVTSHMPRVRDAAPVTKNATSLAVLTWQLRKAVRTSLGPLMTTQSWEGGEGGGEGEGEGGSEGEGGEGHGDYEDAVLWCEAPGRMQSLTPLCIRLLTVDDHAACMQMLTLYPVMSMTTSRMTQDLSMRKRGRLPRWSITASASPPHLGQVRQQESMSVSARAKACLPPSHVPSLPTSRTPSLPASPMMRTRLAMTTGTPLAPVLCVPGNSTIRSPSFAASTASCRSRKLSQRHATDTAACSEAERAEVGPEGPGREAGEGARCSGGASCGV